MEAQIRQEAEERQRRGGKGTKNLEDARRNQQVLRDRRSAKNRPKIGQKL